jgi:hypothetical protein
MLILDAEIELRWTEALISSDAKPLHGFRPVFR